MYGLCGYGRPIAGCPAGRPAGCLHPFGCAPAWRVGGHGAVRVQGRAGPITFPFPPPRRLVPPAAGNTRLRGHAPVRAGSSRCLAGGVADMPVAHALEHLGQHDPRGGGLGNAAPSGVKTPPAKTCCSLAFSWTDVSGPVPLCHGQRTGRAHRATPQRILAREGLRQDRPLTGREIRLRKTCKTEPAAQIELGELLEQASAGQ